MPLIIIVVVGSLSSGIENRNCWPHAIIRQEENHRLYSHNRRNVTASGWLVLQDGLKSASRKQ
jgi:hypothetical protein